MTLKQKMLLKELPNNKYNLSKTAMKVGYSKIYAYSSLHNDIRKPNNAIREYFNENTVKRDIKKLKRLVLKAKDYTNFMRATELESKILGMQIDKSENKTELLGFKSEEKEELVNLRGKLLSLTLN